MNKSTELRWVSNVKFHDVEHWFSHHGKAFINEWQRSDFYIHLDGYDKLSFKIREGKAEIKILTDSSTLKVSDMCSGIIEHWVKWSNPLKEHLTAEQIFADKKQLIELKKERLLITYSINNNNISIVNDNVHEGCQVELARLSVYNQQFYSFGFEAFGSDDQRTKHLKAVTAIVFQEANIKTELSVTNSYNYPELLSKHYKMNSNDSNGAQCINDCICGLKF